MEWLRKLDDNFEEWISFILFSLLIVLIFLQVVFRFVLNFSLDWTEEMSRYTFVALVYTSAIVGVKKNKHLRTEGLIQALPKNIKKWVNIFSDVIWLAFTVLMIRLSYLATMSAYSSGQESPILNVMMAYIYAVVPISFTLMAIRITQKIIIKIKNRNHDFTSAKTTL